MSFGIRPEIQMSTCDLKKSRADKGRPALPEARPGPTRWAGGGLRSRSGARPSRSGHDQRAKPAEPRPRPRPSPSPQPAARAASRPRPRPHAHPAGPHLSPAPRPGQSSQQRPSSLRSPPGASNSTHRAAECRIRIRLQRNPTSCPSSATAGNRGPDKAGPGRGGPTPPPRPHRSRGAEGRGHTCQRSGAVAAAPEVRPPEARPRGPGLSPRQSPCDEINLPGSHSLSNVSELTSSPANSQHSLSPAHLTGCSAPVTSLIPCGNAGDLRGIRWEELALRVICGRSLPRSLPSSFTEHNLSQKSRAGHICQGLRSRHTPGRVADSHAASVWPEVCDSSPSLSSPLRVFLVPLSSSPLQGASSNSGWLPMGCSSASCMWKLPLPFSSSFIFVPSMLVIFIFLF
ncbi:mucin-1-like [Heterocephalus glaber]|uniref:Mucin-1-like n=1 Tax=Heterocephalus glaber TaxID=10181 RepID=A0AAX6THX8_HETGA|nr:mucin-1-like [Heterocephalus glaber]